jgi:CopG family nickel-responsive transcriptional regulator
MPNSAPSSYTTQRDTIPLPTWAVRTHPALGRRLIGQHIEYNLSRMLLARTPDVARSTASHVDLSGNVMTRTADKANLPVSRISVSMAQDLLLELDEMIGSRGYESRSQAISDMVNQQLIEHKRQLGNEVMAGTVTIFYDRATRGLQKRISDLQYKNIHEVISSLHVHLSEDKMMEVILVQGPAPKLQAITNALAALKGVVSARLQLMAAAIPPLHPPQKALPDSE